MTKLYKRLPLFIWLLLALFLARAFIYAYYVPPWQGPDEPQHYDYIHSLQIEKSLPVLGEVTLCNKVRSSLTVSTSILIPEKRTHMPGKNILIQPKILQAK
ncbi:hypothetical protein LCGC14_0739000 [marine sediment metagenome]|uniref:Uncharacterized protein n=1 Tax=marine sediment metagenome TaxID=412755 RepID=A0A0F9TEI0_9ZZZZ